MSKLMVGLLLGLATAGTAMAGGFPVKLISAQEEPRTQEAAALTTEDKPIIVIGEADAKNLVVGDIAASYDFALYDMSAKQDTGQSHSGFVYLVDNQPTKEKPTGKYRFALRYWLEKDAKFPVALYYKDKAISNTVKVEGSYTGPKF